MCTVFFAQGQHPNYPLIIAANRDEFYQRPTLPMHWWTNEMNILAGKDERGGGTWMGFSKQGRFAFLTNFREGTQEAADAPTRGNLVTDFLKHASSAEAYLKQLEQEGHQYNGFNLVFGDTSKCYHFSNRGKSSNRMSAGIHGISNHLMNTPWPKVVSGKSAFTNLVQPTELNNSDFFEFLQNDELAPDETLPNTGVSAEWERILSGLHVRSEHYGTRCSTVALFGIDGSLRVQEMRFPEQSITSFEIQLQTTK